jgi:uncharacterized membrane protein YeaQ/YmgE (transglycosylase-associated protein family)
MRFEQGDPTIGTKIVNKTGSGMVTDVVLGVVGGYLANLVGYDGVTGVNIIASSLRSLAPSSCCWSIARS